ncbi:CocE/NonD family hydrolase [Streptomyces europaeiscabiei]|uniref:CocE/NonD family hydrolase n=1 Tax=Streptomyces europaeiscabiei TaxID=146819 RepID=UPI0029B9211A|nr:CocE/NonD family hydrolase [Streptomyces europaeiscabiei]MDX3837453.1 CocE/NonD family hydrolase [Streptomyces europaeiscabiei]
MPDVTARYDVPATMRDGTVLRADVYQPVEGGPWPVLLTRLPYGKNTPFLLGALEPTGLARKGFLVVIQDTRGRFASDGAWDPWTHEADDGYDTVRWAAALPGSNGRVGMFGQSYFGNTQWMAALSKPPELKAIVPLDTFSEPDDGLFARGGARELGIALPWSLQQGVDTILRRHAADPAALPPALQALVHDLDMAETSGYRELPAGHHPAFQRHGIPDIGYERSRQEPEWSSACRVAGRQAEVDLPSLQTGGWYDIFSQGTLDNFAASHAAGRPSTLIMGPWTHLNHGQQIGDVNFGMAASAELLGFRGRLTDIQSTWLRQWLTPETTPSGPELPPVLLFVMGRNEWREEQEWPLACAVDTDLFLRADGALTFELPQAGEESDTYTYDPADPVPTMGGALLMTENFRPGPLDQAAVEARPDVVVYTTEPLTEDLEVTGRVRAILHAATDAPTTDWVVRLCDVDTAGVSRNIVDGIVRSVTTPGEFTEHAVDLWSTSHVFLAGHRVRVHVTSSNFPRWDRNLNTADFLDGGADSRPARQQVAHDAVRPSRIVLPVVPTPAG